MRFLLCVLAVIATVAGQNIFKQVKNIGEDAISTVAHPVEKIVVASTLKKCDVFKAIFGVTFAALNASDPDISTLKLELNVGSVSTPFNLSDAAEHLLKHPDFDIKIPTVFFLHGFTSSPIAEGAQRVIKAFTTKKGKNILALDSSSMIGFFYLRSSTLVQFIGGALGKVLVKLVEGGVNPEKIHIVGHSLGSHIAGFAGKSFHNLTGKKIDHITGLDVAGPCFFQERPDLRLKKTDAAFVDVIHTDGNILGLKEPTGIIDFYPNKGENQPGCVSPTCSHSRAWKYYSESILSPEAFPAVPCDGYDTYLSGGCDDEEKVFMGYAVDRSKKGIYFLKTNRESIYGLGKHEEVEATTKGSFLSGIFG